LPLHHLSFASIKTSWGATSSGRPSTILQHAEIDLLDSETCADKDEDLRSLLSSTSFCGGKPEKGIAACEGDSGGSVYVINQQTNRIELHGIVSHSIKNAATNEGCEIKKYSILTKVLAFVEWIKREQSLN